MTKHKLKEWNHIVDGEVQKIFVPHPLEGKQKNEEYIKNFVKLIPQTKYQKISKNLFNLNLSNNVSYDVYIEHCDGGGREIHKKVSIPSSKEFKNKIKNFKSVLLINVYYFLKKEENIKLDKEYVFLIIDPLNIVKSKVMKTNSPSSRWVTLNDILRCYKEKGINNFVMNKENNVFLIHPQNIQKFLNTKFFIDRYKEMAKYYFYSNHTKISEKEKYKNIGKIFREQLAIKRGLVCEWKNCNVKVSELIIASHIKAQRFIKKDLELTEEEKFEQLIDENNGFLFCKRHDAMFDKHLFTFSANGKVDLINQKIESVIESFCSLKDKNEQVVKINEKMFYYLYHHRKECLNKSKEI